MKFNEKLMKLRKVNGLSQEELGYKLNVTRQTVSKWELGQTTPEMDKLIEIAKFFNITLDELINDSEINDVKKKYKESSVEKHNKKIALKVFICGLIISIVLCGVGLIRQNIAKKTDNEKREQALAESQSNVDAANERLEEIKSELTVLEEQYETKKQEADSMDMRASNWFADKTKSEREAASINEQINSLNQEGNILLNRDYTVYYTPVKPITYLVFYYIAAGIFALASLISLIYFLVTRKK